MATVENNITDNSKLIVDIFNLSVNTLMQVHKIKSNLFHHTMSCLIKIILNIKVQLP